MKTKLNLVLMITIYVKNGGFYNFSMDSVIENFNIRPLESSGLVYLLDGRRALPALLENAHEKLALETIVLEFVALGGRDVL